MQKKVVLSITEKLPQGQDRAANSTGIWFLPLPLYLMWDMNTMDSNPKVIL